MRSWSLRPPNTVLSGLASCFGASAGAALNARKSLQSTKAGHKEALAEQDQAYSARHKTCWLPHPKLGQPVAETPPFSSPSSTSGRLTSTKDLCEQSGLRELVLRPRA